MTPHRSTLLDQLRKDDEGFGLILVIGFGLVLTALVVVATTLSTRAIQSGQRHVVFEQSADAAEAGVDQFVARLQKNTTYAPVTIAQPAAFDGTSGWSSPTAERDWAKQTLTTMAATASNLQTVPQGQYIAIRPSWTNTIYSMGWAPSYAKSTRTRLLKSEYLFSTYHPANAILTNGNITCCPSYSVGNAPGVSSTISIHTNGTLGGVPAPANGETVTASATGTCSAPCVSGTPLQSVPTIDPEQVYKADAALYASAWYDLCPDGKAHKPDLTNFVPCGNSATWPSTNGWSASGTPPSMTWDASSTPSAGVYYAYKANVTVDKTDMTNSVTVITESSSNNACPKVDGNLTVKQSNWSNGSTHTPYIPGLMAVAGGSFYQSPQTTMQAGAVLAQGSVNQSTSAHDFLQGLLIAQNSCGETNSLQGSILYYDGGDDLPIAPLVRTTLELELN
ncbi:MAG: hypothetical protein JWP14_306 [Frankiales bacterium]|nr:hypothetical protein [Frankiales bacterium]